MDLTADRAAALLARIRPDTPVERTRKELARELVEDIRRLDARLTANKTRMADVVAESDSRLTTIDRVGPVVAARLLGRTGQASRFPTAAAFASYCGTAPIEISSADKTRHGYPATATGSSTTRCTPSRSPRCACPPAAAAPTTSTRSAKARPTPRRCAACASDSPTTSGEP